MAIRVNRSFPLFYTGSKDNPCFNAREFRDTRQAWAVTPKLLSGLAGISTEALFAWENWDPSAGHGRFPKLWKSHLIPMAHEGLGEAIIMQQLRILRARPPRSKVVQDALVEYAREVIDTFATTKGG